MKKYCLFFSIFFLTTSVLINSQESEKKLLDLLTEKGILSESERQELISDSFSDIAKENEESLKGFLTSNIKLGGYAKLLYQYNDASAIRNTFSPRMAFLSLNGKISEQLSFYSLFSFVGQPLYELWLQWKPADFFVLKIGQQKVPFTFENMISQTLLESVYNSRPLLNLAGMSNDLAVNNGGGRDIGFSIFGNLFKQATHYLLHYDIGVFQGTGLNMKDNNNKKDFVASLAVQPIYGLRVGYGLYLGTGHYSINDELAQNHLRNRHALSADFEKKRFYSRAEYLFGKDGNVNKEGITALVQWEFLRNKLHSFARFDYFSTNKKNNSYAMDYTLGCNFYFAKMCRFELNYIHSNYSKNWLNAKKSNQILGQIQIVF